MKKFILTELQINSLLNLLGEIPSKISFQIIQLLYSFLKDEFLEQEDKKEGEHHV